jgi:plastocyanin
MLLFHRSIAATRYTFGALLGLALLAGACGSSSTTSTAPSNPGTGTSTGSSIVTITIHGGVYSPNPLTVTVGQQVNWLNQDSIAHTATDPGVFDTGSIAPTSAADVPVTMNTAGTFNFHCTIHAGENGTIIVQ